MSELKEVMMVMQVSGEHIPSGYYKKLEVDAVLAGKDKEIAKLQADIADLRDDKKSTDAILDERNAEIANKDKEIRRLKRALYKALANWAHEAKFDYDDEFSLWDKMEQKCLKESKQYKEDS